MNASVRAVSCRVSVFPTLRTSIPSVVIPTLNSGCSLIPCSIMLAENFHVLTLAENLIESMIGYAVSRVDETNGDDKFYICRV